MASNADSTDNTHVQASAPAGSEDHEPKSLSVALAQMSAGKTGPDDLDQSFWKPSKERPDRTTLSRRGSRQIDVFNYTRGLKKHFISTLGDRGVDSERASSLWESGALQLTLSHLPSRVHKRWAGKVSTDRAASANLRRLLDGKFSDKASNGQYAFRIRNPAAFDKAVRETELCIRPCLNPSKVNEARFSAADEMSREWNNDGEAMEVILRALSSVPSVLVAFRQEYPDLERLRRGSEPADTEPGQTICPSTGELVPSQVDEKTLLRSLYQPGMSDQDYLDRVKEEGRRHQVQPIHQVVGRHLGLDYCRASLIAGTTVGENQVSDDDQGESVFWHLINGKGFTDEELLSMKARTPELFRRNLHAATRSALLDTIPDSNPGDEDLELCSRIYTSAISRLLSDFSEAKSRVLAAEERDVEERGRHPTSRMASHYKGQQGSSACSVEPDPPHDSQR